MKQTPRILLIDDETEILEILGFILRREGFEIEVASSGQAALDKILNQKFDGVVSDLKMPGMDGLTLLKTVRSYRSLLPFLFLSGHAQPNDEREMINYGAYQLIVKPHVDKVPSALRALLQNHQEIEKMKNEKDEANDLFLDLIHSSNRKVV